MIKYLIESSLDNLRYISDLQLFDAQSIPRIENNTYSNLNLLKFDEFSCKYDKLWLKNSNLKNNYILRINKMIDDFNNEIIISKLALNDDKEFKNQVLSNIKNRHYSTLGFQNININGINMLIVSSLAYSNNQLLEQIFTYFKNEDYRFCVCLTHKCYSDAKDDYYSLIYSMTSENIPETACYCMNCGAKIEEDSKFCIKCGFKLV